MNLKIKSSRLILLLVIVGAFWYRLFDQGSGIIGRSFLYEITIIVLLFVLVLSEFWRRKLVYAIQKGAAKSTVITYGIMMLYGVITLFWVINKTNAYYALLNYFLSAIIIIEIVVSVNSIEDALFCCKCCFFNVILTLIVAIVEGITGKYIFGITTLITQELGSYIFNLASPLAQFNHPNNLATAIILSFPFCIVALNFKKRRFWFTAVFSAIVLLLMVATDSRFTIVVFGLYLLMYMYIHDQIGKVIFIFLMTLTISSFVFLIVENDSFAIVNMLGQEARPLIWENSFNNFLDSSGMGVGIGNAAVINAMTARYGFIGRPCHNYILEVFEELGIIGGVVFVTWYISCLKNSIKVIKNKKSILTESVLMFLVIYLPMTIQQSSMLGHYTIWMLFGVGLAITKIYAK